MNAISLVMETGFAVTAFLSLILNLIIPNEDEDDESMAITAATVDVKDDEKEWERIRSPHHVKEMHDSDEIAHGSGDEELGSTTAKPPPAN